ncbi:uncharacterized protein [Haliotis asinina]|uniref:uncharacterized protein n=1 Tax=Haliotis asinina TaxID=109174 RepID=UPI0035320CFA
MWKFVTVQKHGEIGLPDPLKASTPEKAKRMAAVNQTTEQSLNSGSHDTTITKRGVKRKRENNNCSPNTRAKIAKYVIDNGNTRAARHFSSVLNMNIGESSVRFMKKAYLAKKKEDKTADICPCI